MPRKCLHAMLLITSSCLQADVRGSLMYMDFSASHSSSWHAALEGVSSFTCMLGGHEMSDVIQSQLLKVFLSAAGVSPLSRHHEELVVDCVPLSRMAC